MKITAQALDAWGTLSIKEDSLYRVLAFADNDEQSRQLKAQPHILQHEYAQAMLLVLLFITPARVLLLGLGGGCLAYALHQHQKALHITAVELRPQVIDWAVRYFQLPQSKKIEIINQDARQALQRGLPRKVDLIFTDLYQADGVDALQLQADFIATCAQQLKPEGWLVFNSWYEHQQNLALLPTLRQHFTDIRTVITSDRNWVILAGKTPHTASLQTLKKNAQQLSLSLGYSLQRHLNRLDSLT